MHERERKAGYEAVILEEEIGTKPLPWNTSAQKAKIIVLIIALEIEKDLKVNIYQV